VKCLKNYITHQHNPYLNESGYDHSVSIGLSTRGISNFKDECIRGAST
jgi:hypothetical protein